MKIYYYLYRITNLINGKIYIGVHKTNDLDDGYMGSGLLIQRAIEKYGIENFEKTILQYFNSAEEMFEAESQVVNEEFVADESTYNLKEGGNGGWDHMNDGSESHIERTVKAGKLGNLALLDRIQNDPNSSQLLIEAGRKGGRNNKGKPSNNAFTGQHHSEEFKVRLGKINSERQSGRGNSQYGKMWIYNEDLKECTRIPKGDPIPEGWLPGRKMKF